VNIAIWIVQGLLALAFLASGGMKVARPKEDLAKQGMTYVEDFSAGAIKAIGAVEVVGAVGLILPAALGIAPILTPIAALGLGLIMIGAVVVHVRRKEQYAPALVLAILSLAVAVLRFGPYAF
jgi:uncharacterized membrane protein YphA (DoxX/SURF4 family)